MKTNNMSELNCPICLNELNLKECTNTNISTTICNHSFHTSCLLKWKNDKCPMCRGLMYDVNENDQQIERRHVHQYNEPGELINRIRHQQRQRQRNEHGELTIDDFSIIGRMQNAQIGEHRNTLLDEFYHEAIMVKEILIKCLKTVAYISSQIFAFYILAFLWYILTAMILLLPFKGYIVLNEYLFKNVSH